MKHFSAFYISEFEFSKSSLVATFHYSFDREVFFEETLDFSSPWFFLREDFDESVLQNLLFHLSLALAISYYKIFPTKKIVIERWYLDEADIAFWKDFYISWLWEFLYKNNISPIDLFEFEIEENIWKTETQAMSFSLDEEYLLPIGGWKDSIVSSLSFDALWKPYSNFVFWKMDTIKEKCIEQNGHETIFVKRSLSPMLFEMNQQWYYNGHVPISGIISFVLTVVTYLYNYTYIVFSNERSANEWNVLFDGLDVNHQYSKSYVFEQKISQYIAKNISENMVYFSLLRWLYEIKISQIFAEKWKEYFSIFSSCNANFKVLSDGRENEKKWCWKCPKCLFVFSMLYPFLEKKEMLQIFWKDLYEDISLMPLYKELLWVSGNKPFECVWEEQEVFLASYLAVKKTQKELPELLEFFAKNILWKKSEIDITTMLKKYFEIQFHDQSVPEFLTKDLENIWQRKQI